MPSGRCCPRGRVTAIIAKMSVVEKLSPFDQDSGEINVIVETPRGCRNKYSYDEKRGVFKLSSVLPAGVVLPLISDLFLGRSATTAIRWTFWSSWMSPRSVDA
jgi:hypothetical protein